MTIHPPTDPLRFIPLAALLLSACGSPSGIRVDVHMPAPYDSDVKTLKLTISALPGGFRGDHPTDPTTAAPVALSYTATDDLVMTFSDANHFDFQPSFSFRIETGNTHDLAVNAVALGFGAANTRIASAAASPVALPAGGEASLSLTLHSDIDNNMTTDTTSVDLATDGNADVVVKGRQENAPLSTVAVCNMDGNGGSLVIGAPGADNLATGTQGTGAVYVVFGGTNAVDLSNSGASQEFHLFGVNSGDRFGASISCVDFDNDHIDDLVIGAPGAIGANGEDRAGRVYVVKGRTNLKNVTIDVGNAQQQTDVEWIGGGARAQLGETLLAAKMQKSGSGREVLIAAPGEGAAGLVHLRTLSSLATPLKQTLSGTAGHVTFAGVAVPAMAIGDLDGDGVVAGGSDVILGDADYHTTGSPSIRAGRVYVFANVDPAVDPTGPGTAFDVGGTGTSGPRLTLTGEIDNTGFGAAVLAFNASGNGADLLVGAPGSQGSGAVLIYEHQNTIFMFAPAAKWTLAPHVAAARFGSTLAASSSPTASQSHLLVGAPDTPSGLKTGAGAVYIYKASPTHLEPVLLETLLGANASDHLGTAIAGGAVGTDDTSGDLLTVAPGAMGAKPGSGVAYVRNAR